MSRLRPALVAAALVLLSGLPLGAQEENEEIERAAEAAVEEGLPAAQDELSEEGVEGRLPEDAQEGLESRTESDQEPDPDQPEPEPADLDLPGLPSAAQRITFELPFAPEKGGGSARGSARSLEYQRQDYVIARGGVEITYADLKFQGDRVEVDLTNRILTARGNVIVDQGPRRLTGVTMVYDIDSETGKFTEASAYVDPDIYFTGAEIEKVGDQIYILKDGVVTSCSSDVPVWSFKAGSARVNTEGYTKVRNTSMRVKKLPILFTPYMLYPSNQERKSGFLFPNVGYSDRRGYQLGMAYYLTMGPSYDATFLAEVYGESFTGVGAEFRYRPTTGTVGHFEGYAIDDPIEEKTRWKALLRHETNDLPYGLRGVIRAMQVSDFDFFRDFERDFSQIALRRISSAAYVTGNWGSHSFNFVLDELETFIRNDITQTQRQLPEIEYLMRPTRLGKLPVYLELASSAHYFQAGRSDLDQVSYGRADLAPEISVPLSYWPWLSVKVTAGGRVTQYEDSLNEQRTALSGESLTRVFPFGDVSIIGPSFSRIFDKKIGAFGKFKHIVEPRITYDFVGDPNDQELVPIFDQIDNIREQSIITYSLVNRLLAKPDDEALGGAREIVSFELSQAYSLNDDQPFEASSDRTQESQKSRIGMRFRFTPALKTNFEARATYSPLFSVLDTASISGNTNFGDHAIGLTWFARKNAELDFTSSHQGRIFASFSVIPSRVRYSLQANYDFVLQELQSQRHIIQFFGQCYGLLFEYRELTTVTLKDTEFRLSISLKNIGTFLDLNGGSSEENF